MGKPLVEPKPHPQCAFCAVRHASVVPGQLCDDCKAAADAGELFLLGAVVGPDAAQTRHGLPGRDPFYRLRLLHKRSARDLGIQLHWARVPPVIPLTAADPDDVPTASDC